MTDTVADGRSADAYRDLFLASHDAVVITDLDGTLRQVNPAGLALFGWDQTDLNRTRFQDYYLDPATAAEFVRRLKQHRAVTDFQVKLKNRDGRVVDALMTVTVKADRRGEMIGYQGIIRDVTDRLRAEESLRRAERRFRLLSENSPDIIYTLDRTGVFTYVSQAWQRLLGHRAEDVVGQPFLKFTRPEDERFFTDRLKAILTSDVIYRSEEGALVAQDGRLRQFIMAGAPNRDRAGRLLGIVGLFKDVSDHRAAEAEVGRVTAWLDRFIDVAPEAIAVLDVGDVVQRVNQEFTRLFGFTDTECRGRLINDLIVPPDQTDMASRLSSLVAGGERVSAEGWRQHRDGRLVDVSIMGTPVIVDGERVGVYGIYRDITERKRAERALRESEERHRTVLEASPDPVVVYDNQGRVIYFNPAFSRVFGWELEERRGMRMDFVPREHLAETREMIEQVVSGRTLCGVETRRLTKSGHLVDVSISGACFFDDRSEPRGTVVTIQDITRRKRAEEQLKRIAYSDMLTGLPNRKSFYKDLDEKIIQSRRRRVREPWALMFMDLDRFKTINDTLGHDIGDRLLTEVAGRIQDCLRQTDYIYRLGGDEFTVMANDLTKDIDAARVAQKILDVVAEAIDIDGHNLYVTASIGIAVFPDDGDEVETMVKNADMAMYAAKEDGNGYRFYTAEMNQRALDRMRLESSLRRALAEHQFELHYQPLVDRGGLILGMEALIRWHHPELGLLNPDRFIPLAEETGAIIPIGEWVLAEACRQTKQWHDQGFDRLYVAVNLSARQLDQPNLADVVMRILEETGFPAQRLKLEMTESGMMERADQAVAQMRRLHRLGITFAIDDFGTGYSSLSHLKRFPVDTLKIDRSFIRDSVASADDREIIKTIISMAGNMGMQTVAEGVETVEQSEFLCGQGCFTMQGFLFGRPVPSGEFEGLLSGPAGEKAPSVGG